MNLAIGFVSFVLSALYLLGPPFAGRWMVKAGSIALLAVIYRRHRMLRTGLLAGAVGDALLGWGSAYFVHGLAAFLLGHLAYLTGFLRLPARRRWWLPGVTLAIYGAVFYAALWPGLGSFRWPVLAYLVVITAMAVASLRAGWVAAAGAVLFLLSDSLLAWNRFHGRLPWPGGLVWLTYYPAQWLIAVGTNMALRASASMRRST